MIFFVEDAMLIAGSIVTNSGGKDPFWSDEARTMVMGLILYVCGHAFGASADREEIA